MSFFDRALAKLTITAYGDRELKSPAGAISAMYNPDSVALSFENAYQDNEFINTNVLSNDYARRGPGELALNLVFDQRMPGNRTSIAAQLGELRALCYTVNPATNELNFLKVSWGNMDWGGYKYYAGRMRSLAFSYTLFDRDGTPLRAEARLTLLADRSIELQKSESRLQAPAVAMLTIPAVASLGLMAAGAAHQVSGGIDYLSLAWANDLDNLDDLQPGRTLSAPAREGAA